MAEKRCSYVYNRVLIDTARVLASQFDPAVVYLTGAQVEMLRNVTQYLNRLETYVSEYQPGYYLAPSVADYDDILEIVADLEETLMGNPNTLFGYSERIIEDMGEIKSGDGTWSAYSEYVPEGKIWLLQHVAFQNALGTRGTLTIRILGDAVDHRLINEANPARTLHVWNGLITMKEDDRIRITQSQCIDGDTLLAGLIANEMDVPV